MRPAAGGAAGRSEREYHSCSLPRSRISISVGAGSASVAESIRERYRPRFWIAYPKMVENRTPSLFRVTTRLTGMLTPL